MNKSSKIMEASEFKIGDKVTHKKYGGEYKIIGWCEKRQRWECSQGGSWYVDEFDESEIIHI